MTRIRIVLLLLLAASGILVAGPAMAQSSTPVAIDPPSAVRGQSVYEQHCAACHGVAGMGDGASADQLGFPPAKLGDFDMISASSLAELFDVTKNGRMERMMPPWGKQLGDQDIWDAVAYAWSLHTSRAEVDSGQTVYEENCATCHGLDGKGVGSAPDLTDFSRTSTVSQSDWLGLLASGRGAMPAFSSQLGAGDQRAVLEYVRSLSMGDLFRGPLVAGAGVISGTISNMTTGEPLSAVTVTLGIFDSTALVDQRAVQTDAKGFYRFEGLPTDSNLTYLARTEYPAGFPYSSDPVTFAGDQVEMNLPVSVYDTTTDPSGVRADRVHLIVEFDSGQALIAELLVFSQAGNRAYVGDGTGVLKFTLPDGATGLEISDGELGARYVATQDGFVDTLPLPPGDGVRQTLYRYSLPLDNGALDLERRVVYPVTAVNALISDVGEKISNTSLTQQASRQTQNGDYFSLLGENLAAGQAISIRLDEVGSVAAPEGVSGSTTRALLFVLLGIAVAGAALLVLVPALRRTPVTVSPGAIPRTAEAVIDALARLDLAHERGEIGDAAYCDERLLLRAQLTDLIRKDRSD